MMDFEAARAKMVDNQIRTTDVTSHSVLNAFLTVPRERFVDAALKPLAYIDEDLLIAPGRFLMEPSPLAKLLQLAAITRNDFVLEIGCGTGYTAALLSQLAGQVVALESDAALAAKARENFAALGCENVMVAEGALEKGHGLEAPYDLVFVSGSVEVVPDELLSQLREGGRLVAVVGNGNAARAEVILRGRGTYSVSPAFNTAVKPLPGFARAAEFVF